MKHYFQNGLAYYDDEEHRLEMVDEFWTLLREGKVKVSFREIPPDEDVPDYDFEEWAAMQREKKEKAGQVTPDAIAISDEQLRTFIAHLATSADVARSAKAAGVSYAAIRRRKQIDDEFAEMWEIARTYWIDNLEHVAMDRATLTPDSVQEMVASNDMLKFMLKANEPRYNEKVKVISDNTTRSVSVTATTDISHMSPEKQAQARSLAREALMKGDEE